MKPLLTILLLLSIAITKTAGGNTTINCCYHQFSKTYINNTYLVKDDGKRSKKNKAERDISLSNVWDGKMLLL